MTNLARPMQIFAWSYVFLYAVCSSLSITQVDIWWQLSEGLRLLHTWTLPTQPVVAYGLPATPYFDEYAGYEVVLALLYKLAGFVGIWAVFAAIYLTILFLPGATTGRKYPAFDLPATLTLLTAVLLIHPRLEQRPEIVGALMQVVLMVVLRASSLERITRGMLVRLFLVFVVWSNVHSTFVFGFFTLGLWFFSEWWTRRESLPAAAALRRGALLAAVALVAASLTPYGPRRLLFPFFQASDPGSTALSPEMWPITDFSTLVEYFVLVALALLAWGILTTRKLPPWLIAFAVFAAAISLHSFRFIDYTAIALLFVYAARDEEAAERPPFLPWFLSLPRDLLLCVLFLFLDVFNLLANCAELRSERQFATHGLRYASDMAAYPVPDEGRRIPVLCGHGMGSYLCFPGHGDFRPLLDSGLAHFSSDTKRYFFFAWLEPRALARALDHLHANYVLIDKDTFPWIPTLHRLPDWQFVTCSPNGMIWKRSPGGPHPLSEADRAQVTEAVAALDSLGAFTYSTLLDRPADSLAHLDHYRGMPWNEPFFNSVCAYVDSVPAADVQSFLATHSCDDFPLFGDILAARVGPDAYDTYIAAHPKQPAVWYAKAIAVRVLLQKGDLAGARQVFDSIPVPASSTSYYALWRAVHAGDKPYPVLGDYGRWQSWDENAPAFMDGMSARLNDRIGELDRAGSP
jgi:hypothetical protein